MKGHLTSLHKSIWDVVEYGAEVPQVGDKNYDSDEADQIRHFNSQATTILLASLSREEYNKVHGLETAKDIWDVLKTTHEGDEVTRITKRETIEGELGRKWDDHEMVKVILRSLVFLNPTQVQLIHGDPRYKLMSPEEVIGNFVSFELMIKGTKQIIERGATSTPEVQPVAFKATEEKKEESTSSSLPIDASKLDNEEMALIIKIKAFAKSSSKGRGETTNPVPRRFATSVVSPV
jgi:hypothetical protein